jgi:hypothetical protein
LSPDETVSINVPIYAVSFENIPKGVLHRPFAPFTGDAWAISHAKSCDAGRIFADEFMNNY